MGIGVTEISALHACNQRLCCIGLRDFGSGHSIEVVYGVWMIFNASGHWVVALCISFSFLN